MASRLENCESSLENELKCIEVAERQKAGTLLRIIPNHADWDRFLATVKEEWWIWRGNLTIHPTCLVVLYGGLAFYEYDENTLWPQFGRSIGDESLPKNPNQQGKINIAFARMAEHLGLRILRDNRTEYIGSAVYHIGIPLSLWDGFLDICEWARCQDDWEKLSDDEWADAVGRRAGGRQRLRRFLIDNREAATAFVKEMFDAREILARDAGFTIRDLTQASLLRPEYFDEVPETAEFLREEDPESLFQDRARLVWNDQRCSISLYLPAVAHDRLPATWHVGALTQEAASTPHELILNSAAFETNLDLELESGQRTEPQRLRGVKPWALFDLESKRYVPIRDELLLRPYVFVSQERIDEISRTGFAEDEDPVNDPFELKDGTTCFITRLWPIGKQAELCLKHRGKERTIRFKTKARIEARLFFGEGERAANFTRLPDKIKMERLPVLCVSLPDGYFRDNGSELNNRFKIFMDERLASGLWERRSVSVDDDRDFYFWRWSRRPFQELKSGTSKSFQQLCNLVTSPDLKGDRILSIVAPRFRMNCKLSLDHSKPGMNKSWKHLPGTFLLWFLLCQSNEGMKWEDLELARDVIAPGSKISYPLLHKYAKQGLLVQRGRRWMIKESRAVLKPGADNECQMEYCGDPSIIWGLYRMMYHAVTDHELPIIEVVEKRGTCPFLRMVWSMNLRNELEKYLKKNGVLLAEDLWTH